MICLLSLQCIPFRSVILQRRQIKEQNMEIHCNLFFSKVVSFFVDFKPSAIHTQQTKGFLRGLSAAVVVH